MGWVGHVAHLGRGEVHKCMVVQYEERRTVGRTRCRWEDNIKMYIYEVGGGGMDWIDLAQDRDRWRALVNEVMNLRIP